ncbi:MAG: hypothetical protein ACM3KD_10575 [Hyphomicrobiaceae bacterium]
MRSPTLPFYFATVTLFSILAGCATPQYQTTVHLIPPDDAQGRACVQNCDAGKTACQSTCQTRYQACAKALAPQVEPRYLEALQQYELELKRYAAALRQYEMQMRFDWMNRYPFQPYWWDPWRGPYYPPPYPEPEMPTREGVRAQLEKSECKADCGCLPAYDTCFVGCGGQRVTETVCVKNCPPAK